MRNFNHAHCFSISENGAGEIAVSCMSDIAQEFYDGCDLVKDDALETLTNWQVDEIEEWENPLNPTDEEIERYDCMIDNCYVEVYKYDPNTDEYTEHWSPSAEDERGCGWMYWNELKAIDYGEKQ